MTEQDYRRLFDRVAPDAGLVERTLAAAEQGAGPRRRRMARRLIAAAACLALVLGVGNYPALAAGAERVFRYILGVGAAETDASLLVQREPISHEDGDFLYLIDGAYQRDGVLTVPLDVVSRSWISDEEEVQLSYRLTVYDAAGEKLPQVSPTGDGEVFETVGAERYDLRSFSATSNWLSQTWQPQGYVSGGSGFHMAAVPQGECGPYTFEVDAYTSDGWWRGTVWKGGVLELDTPQAVEATEISRAFAEGTVTALVGADGRSVSFYGVLAPRLARQGERLIQLSIPTVWFVDEAGNRYPCDQLRWSFSEVFWPEFRLVDQPEGEIAAIEVNEVYFNILRADQPQDGPRHQYMPDYHDVGWVIPLT